MYEYKKEISFSNYPAKLDRGKKEKAAITWFAKQMWFNINLSLTWSRSIALPT